MTMDYQGNTNKSKEESAEEPKKAKAQSKPESDQDQKLEKIVVGEVVTRKKPLGSRMKEIFFGGDFTSAGQYIAAEVLLPAFRNLLIESITKGAERVVLGDSSLARGRPQPGYGPRVTYNSPINRGPYREATSRRANLPDQPTTGRPRGRHDNTEIVLASRGDAEMVLERMQDIIDRYQVVSMADLHELTGLPAPYTDNKWGWESLRFAEIRQIREGYLLDLPPAETL